MEKAVQLELPHMYVPPAPLNLSQEHRAELLVRRASIEVNYSEQWVHVTLDDGTKYELEFVADLQTGAYECYVYRPYEELMHAAEFVLYDCDRL